MWLSKARKNGESVELLGDKLWGLEALCSALDCAYPPIVTHVALTIDQHKSNQGADWLSWCGQYNKVSLSTSCIFIPPSLPLQQQRQRVD